MKCIDPYVKSGEVFACGRCLPCLKKKRWEWFQRLQLEASQHAYSCVVTLTYDNAALPETRELQPEHLRNWLKRYRKRALERYAWRYIRFFACGEYGELSKRPHYHVVLFGQPGCSYGRTGRSWAEECSCDTCFDVSSTWGLGATSVDRITKEALGYVAGYVTRKFSAGAGFTRMSRNPGIGCSAMWDYASVSLHYDRGVVVPSRYLRSKLAEYSAREAALFSPSPAMQNVCGAAWLSGVSQKSLYRQINEPYASQLEQAAKLKEKLL